jgi:hypothetical protein
MKKVMLLMVVLAVFATVAMAQPSIGTTGYTQGQGIINMDKLGAHQNGGRGCTGCHAPHSGARGNGGALTDQSVWTPGNTWGGVNYGGTWSNMANLGNEESGNEALWGQDIGPIMTKNTFITGGGAYTVDLSVINSTNYGRMMTGIVYCLSCHDGQVAKGAMMTNASFEQAAGLLPATYGSQTIPTLLGADGGPAGNYLNDHPIGPSATVASVGIKSYVALDNPTTPTKLVASGSFTGSPYQTFQTNYGLPVVIGARAGAGFAVDQPNPTSDTAYVVCTTCHTPHTMFRATASSTNPIGGLTSGAFPSFFFIAAPYNPAAQVGYGQYASSSTQFCRQCHFSGAGGSNESVGITNIKTAF